MADLILEFGCESCYLQDKVMVCRPSCTRNLDIDLSELFSKNPIPSSNYFNQGITGTFTVKKDFFYGKCMPDVYRYDLIYRDYCGWILCKPNNTDCAGTWKSKKLIKPKGISDLEWSVIENKWKPIKTDDTAKNILIVLESPHDVEYDYGTKKIPNFAPIQPANGATGINFYEFFTKGTNAGGDKTSGGILNYIDGSSTSLKTLLDENDVYHICFVNPVPFQTSLHFFHRESLKEGITADLRNIVWKRLFEKCENDFIQRVRSYKPFAIINSCTGDITKNDSVKSQVKNAINNLCQHQFYATHPSSWSRKINNRYCKKC